MEVSFICNAGLVLTYGGKTLIVDAPNLDHPPFFHLSNDVWNEVRERYDICGFFFTHDHPDHLDRKRLAEHITAHPCVRYHIPDTAASGTLRIGPFEIEYHPIPHTPIPNAPIHMVAHITAGEKSVYVSADAALEPALHRKVLCGRKVDAAIWNSMYLSHEETRALMTEAAVRNYIYHMPARPDTYGMWKKCEKNFERYEEELKDVHVIGAYPETVIL